MTTGTTKTPPWELDTEMPPLVKSPVKLIATELFRRITAGDYAFGTRIPPERDLADEFKESRTTIRQSLDFLEHYGIIARRASSGTFVTFRTAEPAKPQPAETSAPTAVGLAETVSPFEVNITRAIIEPEIVRLAAIYMSVRDLAALGDLMQQLEAIVADGDKFAELERQFFLMLCEGTHNALLIAMYRIIHDIRQEPQWVLNKTRTLTPARIREALQGLRSLHTALERRNVETAVECMRLYISSMQEELIYTSP